ncbi:MGDG synthase family glycosyltransferase [Falsibacillus pallidus]|uniref:Processive 1,2-diacylglycerol beta-glucosyltransferase n=1 Tax=Falsibacillus pallidus TaxID=493781 RepID=A0A370GQ71_9BACI|nr:glycosyltransferase [Falsibacillus pallidus]RDI45865.1 processive 1,2-diacylglycerol beta-glucosyltransferase [Falsibacillus pallidus]
MMKFTDSERILILSASVGDGHNQVAKALSEAVVDRHPAVEPVVIDTMEWLHPYLSPISTLLYKKSIKNFPQVYSFLYRKTQIRNSFSTRLNSIFTIGMNSMLKIIEKIRPSAIISTHPFAAGIVSKLKEQRCIDIPAVTVITDYAYHSYWIYPFTDQYIVGSRQVKDELMNMGVEEYKIKATGIPLRRRFNEILSRKTLFAKYNLRPDKFTLLVMGGGDGFFNKESFEAFEDIPYSIQLIIICGRNEKLRQHLEREFSGSKHDVLLMGFTENVHEIMAISDLMITKPGGVTSSEAIAMNLPLLLFNPLPGQEEDNAQFLLQSGLARLVHTPHELIYNINRMLNDPRTLTYMRYRARKYQMKSASNKAVGIIEQMTQKLHIQEIV